MDAAVTVLREAVALGIHHIDISNLASIKTDLEGWQPMTISTDYADRSIEAIAWIIRIVKATKNLGVDDAECG